VQVTAGAQHSCALHASGRVTCWGLAESIQAGGAAVLAPREIADLDRPLALAAGGHQTCAIVDGRRLRCWGNEMLDVVDQSGKPLEGVVAVALSADYGCAIAGPGTLCWGNNDFGQLARPLTVTDSAAAVLSNPTNNGAPEASGFVGTGIAALAITSGPNGKQLCAWGRNASKLIDASDDLGVRVTPVCRPVDDVVALAVGDTHACIRHSDGRFTCWGERYYGELGIGGVETADVGPPGMPTALAAPVVELVAGVDHTCVRLMNDEVICFGRNNLGQIGGGVTTAEEDVRQPTVVTGLGGKVIALGAGSTAQHTCAILVDGSVQCWGSNSAGQLGDAPAGIDPARKSAAPVTVGF
jgi:alpha-tubulin suppressor-like RCC1 family protein